MPQCRNFKEEDLEEMRFLSGKLEYWKYLSINSVMSNDKMANIDKKICEMIQNCLDKERMWYGRFYRGTWQDGASIRLFEKN